MVDAPCLPAAQAGTVVTFRGEADTANVARARDELDAAFDGCV